MTIKQSKRARKHANRKAGEIARRPHKDHTNERGLHAADLYIDVLFGRREGRIDG